MSALFGDKPSAPYVPPGPDPTPPPVPTAASPDAVQARARYERSAQARQGRQSTILTSATGLQPTTPTGSTLLGS